MSNAYLCPNCKSNRTRFNVIEQVPTSVKLDPATGAVVTHYENDEQLDPFHLPYNGTQRLVQCAACGVVADETTFVKHAQHKPL
ncbi:hypothetical protein A374_04639 [Fictibacillus macauensis ZFHKF-1]|uniref:DNA alkylation repair protein n=1 Tax=Fictibacillus macauensis ZFHKF-1 TaxID=1196324 RepID=I8ALN3_9BACL|nr:hypothetical protein [Fictibacillus macauensis]EIT86832.1 hypothetical protein A374_04639 [Fictibacillus macauensis ZFHKF-1]